MGCVGWSNVECGKRGQSKASVPSIRLRWLVDERALPSVIIGLRWQVWARRQTSGNSAMLFRLLHASRALGPQTSTVTAKVLVHAREHIASNSIIGVLCRLKPCSSIYGGGC